MKRSGFILVPLFCCCALLFAAVSGAAPKSNETATAPALFKNNRPPTPATDLLPSLRSRLPVQLNVSLPAGLANHGPGHPSLGAPEVGNRAPIKHASMTTPAPKNRFGTRAGGEDFGSATPIASLPYADSSNTCGHVDDYTPICGASGGPDVVYSYSPSADGCIQISLCGSDYDTEIHVVDGSGPDIACNDDFCGLQSTLSGLSVLAGHTYYIIVDGYGSNCGNYLLHVDACPPPPPGVECPPDAVAEGEPLCGPDYVDSYNGGCNSFPEVYNDIPCGPDSVKICGEYGTYLFQGSNYRDTDWYRITVGNTTTFHWCVTGQYATALYLVDGRAGCGAATVIDLNFGNPGETACLNTTVPGGGTYYLVVAPNTFTDVPCGSNYYMTFVVDSCPEPPPPPECPPNAIAEGEPTCGDEYVDNFNGGCNSSPEVYTDIPCTPGVTTYCGAYGTYLYQGLNYRDTDWYRIVVNRTSTVSFDVTGQYATSIYLLDGRLGCNGISLICGNSGSPSQPISCSAQLSPGTYYLFVATTGFAGDPCGGIYVMNVVRDSCPEPFVLTCPPGAKPEGEVVCYDGYNDNYNAGCNSDPPTFSNPYGGGTGNSNCVPGTVYVCGTYGTYINQGLNYRDTDWYQIPISGNTHLRYCVVGEASTAIFVLNGTAGCNGLSVVCSDVGGAGDTLCCEVDLTPGTYWLFVGTADFVGVPCGSRYVVSLTQGACPEPVHLTCPPGAIPEGEPNCSDLYVDNYNGGCNSVPPVFTPLPCVDGTVTYCGTYGTYRFQGVEFRDTDWYQMPLADPHHISFCVVGEAPTSIFILNAAGGCATITIVASASGAAGDTVCCEADLPPGMYWLFVATTDFSGVTCGSKYVATVYGYSCTGPTPVAISNVHALNQRGFVDVRWNAPVDPGAEFQVLRAATAEGPFAEVGEAVTSIGNDEFSMIDRAITPSTEYFYRINYRQGGSWLFAATVRIVTPEGLLAINAIRPNPTSGNTRIDYELPRAGNLRLEVFDVAGHKVRTLANAHAAAGTGSVVWDGRDGRGRELPGGAYFIRAALDQKVVTRQVSLVR